MFCITKRIFSMQLLCFVCTQYVEAGSLLLCHFPPSFLAKTTRGPRVVLAWAREAHAFPREATRGE